MFVAGGAEESGEGEGASLDAGERVADLVGDAGSEDAEGREFLALFEGEAGLVEAGAEWGDQVAPDEEPQASHEGEQGPQGSEGEVVEGGGGLLGVEDVLLQFGSVEAIEVAGKGEEGDGVLFELVDELGGFRACHALGTGGEKTVGVGFERFEGGEDTSEDGGVRTGGGLLGLVGQPGAESAAGSLETVALGWDAGDAVAREGVVHFQHLGLVVFGELLAGFEGGPQLGETAGFAPRNPGPPTQRRRDHQNGGSEQRQSAREVKLHPATMSKPAHVATVHPGLPPLPSRPACVRLPSVKWSILIGRPFGVEVRLHLTFLLLLAFFAWRGWSVSGTAQGALSSVLLQSMVFGCVLLHEFGHVLMARRFGIRTQDVTLLPIGGVARMASTGETPRQELLIALAGPAVNVVIAGLAFLWWVLVPRTVEGFDTSALKAPAPLALMIVNVFLVVFNLIPAFPMDGGRVLRAILSWRGNRVWATRVAAGIGKAVAILLGVVVLLGMAGVLPIHQPLLLFIAVFVWIGASQEAQAVATTSLLHDVSVRETMMTEFHVAEPFSTLREVSQWLLAGYQQDFPVVAQGEVVGMLPRDDFFRALAGSGPDTLVRDVMRADFSTAAPTESIEVVLRRAQAAEGAVLTIPVIQAGVLVGMVTPENVGEFVMVRTALRGVGKGG